ncbi:MAG: hypothetical protein JSR36_19105 [Proteobacteria bacterium]|nr:hypothetical protein [Pseudomonadota bacterium]
MSAPSILAAYRWFFCLLLLLGSAQGLLSQPGEHAHAALLGAAEACGALLLLARRTQWLGAWLLLAVFSVAQTVAALASAWPVRFALYAAGAFLIVLMDRALRQPPAH